MTTLTRGATTLTPSLVLALDTTREAGTRVHPVLNSGTPDVTLRPHGLRSGTLRLFYTAHTDALAAEVALAGTGVWYLNAAPDVPTLAFQFVVSGDISVNAERGTTPRWVLEFAFQEVGP